MSHVPIYYLTPVFLSSGTWNFESYRIPQVPDKGGNGGGPLHDQRGAGGGRAGGVLHVPHLAQLQQQRGKQDAGGEPQAHPPDQIYRVLLVVAAGRRLENYLFR